MPSSSDHSDDEYSADDSGQDPIPMDVTEWDFIHSTIHIQYFCTWLHLFYSIHGMDNIVAFVCHGHQKVKHEFHSYFCWNIPDINGWCTGTLRLKWQNVITFFLYIICWHKIFDKRINMQVILGGLIAACSWCSLHLSYGLGTHFFLYQSHLHTLWYFNILNE